jgi:hypothetical protein
METSRCKMRSVHCLKDITYLVRERMVQSPYLLSQLPPKMIFCKICNEMLSLQFMLDAFCLFEARALRIEDSASSLKILGQLCKWRLHQILGLELPIGRIYQAQNTMMIALIVAFCFAETKLVLLAQLGTHYNIRDEPSRTISAISEPSISD